MDMFMRMHTRRHGLKFTCAHMHLQYVSVWRQQQQRFSTHTLEHTIKLKSCLHSIIIRKPRFSWSLFSQCNVLVFSYSYLEAQKPSRLVHGLSHWFIYEYHTWSEQTETVWLSDEDLQKAMPKQTELWDITALDRLNKQGACGGHQGQGSGQWGLAQHPEEGDAQRA